jgi:phosphate:Na+ symporter
MEILVPILKLLAGIGMFLFAMYLIEESLKNLSGRNFKLFLQRITKNNLGAVAGGAIVTAVLQSSSMVSLMVLAFVGAGIFTMKNALAIILGANLGTTIDSWIVATLGFKVNIEIMAYPAICVGGFLLFIVGSRKVYKYISYFLLGFGLLFIGLSFMKTAMEAQTFDFAKYESLPVITFLFIGFVITLVVQSSSVTMALALSALHAHSIGFLAAAAIVLGSETGTTIKIVIGAIGGNATKKQVAAGNLIFNVLLTIVAFVFINPILLLITDVMGIKDPLIGLVTFSTLNNFLGIILFLPFLNFFERLFQRFYKDSYTLNAGFIGHATIDEPETAIDLFRKEAAYFIHNSMYYNLTSFGIEAKEIEHEETYRELNKKRDFYAKTPEEKYEFLKHLQGELQVFYSNLTPKVQGEQAIQINQLVSAVRSSMHSVKSIKDIQSNINNLSRSSKDIKFDFFVEHKKETEQLYQKLNGFVSKDTVSYQELESVFNEIEHNYTSALDNFYKSARLKPIEDLDFTTAINFNRELFTSNKAMLMAVKDFLLNEKDAEAFNELPVYRT